MNNQLPENKTSQDGSDKTENGFQPAKKPKIPNWVNWVIFGVVVLIAGKAIWYYSSKGEEPIENYYQSLAGECEKNQNKSCCLASVKEMQSNGYKQVSADGCPEGLQKNQLLCTTSYSWCEPKTIVVFFSQEECEQKTSQSCDFHTCDFIPPGKTFEEVCGKDFEKGWIPKNPILNIKPLENQKITGRIIFSDIEGGCWGFQSDSGKYFMIGNDDKSEEIKKIPDIFSKKVEIQGKIEKDIVHFCPIGEGLFKLESYGIMNDSILD